MSYYLAVDAGGSKAEFLLATDERELARVRTPTIKRVNADEVTAEKNLTDAVADLERATGVAMAQVTRACIGTSGDTVPLVTDWLRESFARHVPCPLLLVGDVEIALDAAFQGGRGVLVLAGTGSNVAARQGSGAIMTAGGWGPVLADQGSGHWIGIEGLRRGFLARDEARRTQLLEAARALWDLPSIDALIEFCNTQHPARYASQFAPGVVACAAEGDPVAQEILARGGQDLAYLAALLIERMQLAEGPEVPLPPVACAGSILAKVEPVRSSFEKAMMARYPDIHLMPGVADPVRGALWRAMQGA